MISIDLSIRYRLKHSAIIAIRCTKHNSLFCYSHHFREPDVNVRPPLPDGRGRDVESLEQTTQIFYKVHVAS